jgi:hypothetical protein
MTKNKTEKKKARPGRTAGQRKGLWVEASFYLDFLHTFSSRKKYDKHKILNREACEEMEKTFNQNTNQ